MGDLTADNIVRMNMHRVATLHHVGWNMSNKIFDTRLQRRKRKPARIIERDALALGLTVTVYDNFNIIEVESATIRASTSLKSTWNDYHVIGIGIYSPLVYSSMVKRADDDNPEWLDTVLDLFYYKEGEA